MIDISDVISHMIKEDSNLRFQLLNDSLNSKKLKGKAGDKYSEISFMAETQRMNEDQEAVIIWTTPDKFNAALARAREEDKDNEQ